jgi:hypothetical protein
MNRVLAIDLVATIFGPLCWSGYELSKQRKENNEWWKKYGGKHDGQKYLS